MNDKKWYRGFIENTKWFWEVLFGAVLVYFCTYVAFKTDYLSVFADNFGWKRATSLLVSVGLAGACFFITGVVNFVIVIVEFVKSSRNRSFGYSPRVEFWQEEIRPRLIAVISGVIGVLLVWSQIMILIFGWKACPIGIAFIIKFGFFFGVVCGLLFGAGVLVLSVLFLIRPNSLR